MTKQELQILLDLHAKWLRNESDGVRADLSRADLSRAYLNGANLSWANLSEANLSEANLSGADLSEANLSWAYLSRANLSGANLSGAYLSRANLSRANLSGANLSGANLSGANLSGANLINVISMPIFQIVSDSGAFNGWKKLNNNIIAQLEIPTKARRVNSTGRKCRAEFVRVLQLYKLSETKWIKYSGTATDRHTGKVVYKKGGTIKPDSYNPDIREECTNGIHFFITRKEAEEY